MLRRWRERSERRARRGSVCGAGRRAGWRARRSGDSSVRSLAARRSRQVISARHCRQGQKQKQAGRRQRQRWRPELVRAGWQWRAAAAGGALGAQQASPTRAVRVLGGGVRRARVQEVQCSVHGSQRPRASAKNMAAVCGRRERVVAVAPGNSAAARAMVPGRRAGTTGEGRPQAAKGACRLAIVARMLPAARAARSPAGEVWARRGHRGSRGWCVKSLNPRGQARARQAGRAQGLSAAAFRRTPVTRVTARA